MDKAHRICVARLVAVFVIDAIAVWLIVTTPGHIWNSIGRDRLMRIEFRENLILGSLAALALVFVVPVARRGKLWQRLFAFVLLGVALLILLAAFAGMRTIG